MLGVGCGGSGGGIYTAALVANLAEKKPNLYDIHLRPPGSLCTLY